MSAGSIYDDLWWRAGNFLLTVGKKKSASLKSIMFTMVIVDETIMTSGLKISSGVPTTETEIKYITLLHLK